MVLELSMVISPVPRGLYYVIELCFNHKVEWTQVCKIFCYCIWKIYLVRRYDSCLVWLCQDGCVCLLRVTSHLSMAAVAVYTMITETDKRNTVPATRASCRLAAGVLQRHFTTGADGTSVVILHCDSSATLSAVGIPRELLPVALCDTFYRVKVASPSHETWRKQFIDDSTFYLTAIFHPLFSDLRSACGNCYKTFHCVI